MLLSLCSPCTDAEMSARELEWCPTLSLWINALLPLHFASHRLHHDTRARVMLRIASSTRNTEANKDASGKNCDDEADLEKHKENRMAVRLFHWTWTDAVYTIKISIGSWKCIVSSDIHAPSGVRASYSCIFLFLSQCIVSGRPSISKLVFFVLQGLFGGWTGGIVIYAHIRALQTASWSFQQPQSMKVARFDLNSRKILTEGLPLMPLVLRFLSIYLYWDYSSVIHFLLFRMVLMFNLIHDFFGIRMFWCLDREFAFLLLACVPFDSIK